MPAARKEVVVQPNGGQTEHVRQDLGDKDLDGGTGLIGGRDRVDVGRGQRGPVHLAARRQRELVEHHHRGRNQV